MGVEKYILIGTTSTCNDVPNLAFSISRLKDISTEKVMPRLLLLFLGIKSTILIKLIQVKTW